MIAQVGDQNMVVRLERAGDAVPVYGRPEEAVQEHDRGTTAAWSPILAKNKLHKRDGAASSAQRSGVTGQGRMGTTEMLFLGDPSITRSL